jgi:hypothetical protein
MITITGFLHRDELHDLIRRWMYGRVLPDDARRIPQVVHYNGEYVRRYLQRFAQRLFGRLHAGRILFQPTCLKGELKDAIVERPPFATPRMAELIAAYRENPGGYYRETPFNGTMFFKHQDDGRYYIGSTRIKRVRRLAEKSARRIIDWLFDTIKARAELLADERARHLAIPRQMLVTEPERMQQEFVLAENRLLEDLRLQRPIRNSRRMVVNDVAGVKVLLDTERQHMLPALLEQMGDCRVIEREAHTGRYNAVNLIVCHQPPREEILAAPLEGEALRAMLRQGLSPEAARRDFMEFVRSGEDSVHMEIIVCDYAEMLESEIGRCMHEDRIIRQRLDQQYRSHLACNIEYLLEYLFAFSAAGRRQVDDLPFKLWNRYLPDYFHEVLRGLAREQTSAGPPPAAA